jgi:hypothetical protein
MRATRFSSGVVVFVLLTQHIAAAQWIRLPLPGTPRTQDGRPDLFAPSPRTPEGKIDLTGIWTAVPDEAPEAVGGTTPRSGLAGNIARDVPGGAPLTSWGRALYEERRSNDGRDVPSTLCLPTGLPAEMLLRLPFKLVQTPAVTMVLLEEFNNWRQIHTDGRSLPDAPEPARFGYSVGRWDRDVFVVTTTGFTDRTWLDNGGTPHSESLRLTEKFRRSDFGHMEIEYTFDDPKAFTKSWSTTVKFQLLPDTELLEHHCENEKDAARIKAIAAGVQGGKDQ